MLDNLETVLLNGKEFCEINNLNLLDLVEVKEITKFEAIYNEIATILRAKSDY